MEPDVPSAAYNTLPADAPPAPLEGRAPLTYKGVRVLTTELAAQAFGATVKNLSDNFANHAARFVEGKHFFKVTGVELKALKNQPDFIGLVHSKTSHLILLTERGVARHAKILDTDVAWEIFEALEDTYFRAKSEAKAPPKPRVYGPAEIRRQWAFSEQIATAVGLFGNPLLIAVNRATKAATNFDVLGAMGVGQLAAPVQDLKVKPSKLADELEITARAVNTHLENMGLQDGDRDLNGRRIWKLTASGKALGAQVVEEARSNDTGMAQSVVWPLEATLSALRAHLNAA